MKRTARRWLALALAAAMVLVLGASALAAEEQSGDEEAKALMEQAAQAIEAGDDAAAVEPLTKAAELGLPEAQANLAFQYFYGLGVEQDYARAQELYEQAAALGIGDVPEQLGTPGEMDHP